MMLMKKIFNIVLTALAVAAIASCGPDVDVPDNPDNNQNQNQNQNQNPDPDDGFGGEVTFNATIEVLSDGVQPSWKTGESISIYDGASVVKATNTAAEGQIGKFPATIKKGTTSVFALYPAIDGIQMTSTSVNVEIPATQTIGTAVPNFRVAKSTNNLLAFRNVVAVLNLTLSFDGATSVVLKAAGDSKIAGTVAVDYSGESPVVAATSGTVELKGEFKKGEKYPLVLAPANLTDCAVEVYEGETLKAHFNTGALNLTGGTVMDMDEVHPDMPIYHITHMWLWGGTGPEWNCTAIYDLFNMKDYFNNEDGRGIEALKDNYLVFNSDGTFRNWAGEDGRNWWYVYNREKNPETAQELDLKNFYEKLPRSEATYTIDEESNVVFTLPSGSTVNAKLLPAGEYEMPETLPALKVKITTQALFFEISGGRDIWDGKTKDGQRDSTMYIYTPYCKLAAHPRALFVEIEQMPDGFELPAAACTTDKDFEYVPPTYTFDINSLPGVWNVYGGNSKPFGLWVNGGSGGDPAFVSPIDKYWNWDDTIYNESDNTLTIAITGQNGNQVSGTIKWEAGADGKFWDCIWKNTGADLSAYFSPLPKGSSNVVVDVQTGAMTIGTDLKATFLTAGMRSFTCGKTLEIPSNCFGLAFHLMEPIASNPEPPKYTDVDRFVNAPLDYVIIFEKE